MSYNSINNMLSSQMRVTGMVSGLDTDSMIKDLMKIERLKVDKVFKQKVREEWRKDALTEVRNKLRTFRETYASVLSKDNMYTSSVYLKYNVEMESNPYVAVSADATARAGSMSINEVTQLAEAAKVQGSAVFNVVPGPYIKLGDLEFADSLFGEGDTISFKINGREFSFNKEQTMKDMTDEISRSDIGVNVFVSSLTKGLHIETKATGDDQKIYIENIQGNTFGENSVFGIDEIAEEEAVTGKNAKLKINTYTIEQKSNKFTIDGITYDLKGTFSSDKQINFTVTRDTQYTVDRIKEFVSKYNELHDYLNGKVNEKKYYEFDPLTDEQKEALEEKEIEKWEEKAKSGQLKNDPAITKLLSQLRESVYKKVEGIGLSLSDIGITTGSFQEKGKLFVDEDKLKKMIDERPEDVMNLFMATNSAGEEMTKAEKYEKDGFFARMTSSFNDYYDTLKLNKMDDGIKAYEEKIKNLEMRIYETQERYYRQFAQLETALAKMQSQQNWFAQQFGLQQ